jgi:hypothetical protein
VHAFELVEHYNVVRDGEPCSGFGSEALPLTHLALQPRQGALRDDVVPTHPRTSRRYAHVDFDAVGDASGGGVSHCSIVITDRPWPQMPVKARRLQSLDHQQGAHVVGDLPAHHHARGEVDEIRQVQPPLTGAQKGDVTDQARAWAVGGEAVAKLRLRVHPRDDNTADEVRVRAPGDYDRLLGLDEGVA